MLYTLGQVTGGLWGGVFLRLLLTFPSGRLQSGWDRRLVIAGYVIFTLANAPGLFVATPEDLGWPGCS